MLVGYEGVIGLVTNDNFERLQFSNFSGRGVAAQNLSHVVRQTAQALIKGHVLSERIIDEVSISGGWKHFWMTMAEAASVNMPTENDHILAEKLLWAL